MCLRSAKDLPSRRRAARFEAPALVVATGGLSIPKIGATDLGYRIARAVWRRRDPAASGAGAAAVRRCRPWPLERSGRTGQFLRRLGPWHRTRGSGDSPDPGVRRAAVIHASRAERAGNFAGVVLLAAKRETDNRSSATCESRRRDHRGAGPLATPRRRRPPSLHICRIVSPIAGSTRWRRRRRSRPRATTPFVLLEAGLHAWTVVPAGTEGYEKAEVTAGGVDTRALSSTTMEVRARRGLYFIGEVVDVTGHLGGFNFQWAWASGKAAGDCSLTRTTNVSDERRLRHQLRVAHNRARLGSDDIREVGMVLVDQDVPLEAGSGERRHQQRRAIGFRRTSDRRTPGWPTCRRRPTLARPMARSVRRRRAEARSVRRPASTAAAARSSAPSSRRARWRSARRRR